MLNGFKAAGLILYALAIIACVVLWYVWAWSFSVHTLLYIIFVSAGIRGGVKGYQDSQAKRRHLQTRSLTYPAEAQRRFGSRG